MKEETSRFRRIIVLCVGAIYLILVIGATVYSQTIYVNQLPVVTLGQTDGGVVPNEALENGIDGMKLNYVQQEDGPWGKRYLLRQTAVLSYRAVDENHTYLYDTSVIQGPIVIDVSTTDYYDGMEVRLG